MSGMPLYYQYNSYLCKCDNIDFITTLHIMKSFPYSTKDKLIPHTGFMEYNLVSIKVIVTGIIYLYL